VRDGPQDCANGHGGGEGTDADGRDAGDVEEHTHQHNQHDQQVQPALAAPERSSLFKRSAMTVMAQIPDQQHRDLTDGEQSLTELCVVASSRMPPLLVVVERSAPGIASASQGACRTG
jgi:hypothetical protein